MNDCNRPDVFIDSALIFTNAETSEDVNGVTQWKFSFQSNKSGRFAWTELMRCAVSEATNQAPNKMSIDKVAPYKIQEDDCEEYYQTNQDNPNRDLANIDIRQSCPMIPIFGDDSKTDDGVITAIAKQFVNTIDQKIEKICETRNTIDTWNMREAQSQSAAGSIPDGHLCYYDIVLALDMDCLAYNENIDMFDFAKLMVSDLFQRFRYDRNIIINHGAIRLAIVGFTNELIIQMNLFEMSSLDGRQEAEQKAKDAIEDLRNAQLSRQSNKSHFLHVFGHFSRLFDARSHKVRELIIVSNMMADSLSSKDWSDEDLERLTKVKNDHFSDTIIRTVAVNDPCDFSRRFGRWQEDCSYFKAFEVIEDNTFARNQYRNRNRKVLVPNARVSPYTDKDEIEAEYRVFYDDILDKIDADLSDDNLKKCRVEPPVQIEDCECATRAHLECHLCEIGGAGPPGPKGPDGEQGPPGLAGLMGSCGDPGYVGTPGIPGEKGLTGKRGLPGPAAPKPRVGSPGDNGFDGAQGRQGNAGGQGKPGQAGPEGRRGLVGNEGTAGSEGPKGQTGLDGEEGQGGPTGSAGKKGTTGKSALDQLRKADRTELKKDMMRRLKKASQDPAVRTQIKVMSQRYVGLGNDGKSFCDCKECDQVTCDPIPAEKCPDCEIKHDVVVALDNSNSVKKTVDEEPSTYQEMNNPDLILGEDNGIYPEGVSGNVMFVRFASRLQTDAVIEVGEDKNQCTYHDYTVWRENGQGALPPRKLKDPKVVTGQKMSQSSASDKLETFGLQRNEYGELIDTMERTWQFYDDNKVPGWATYNGNRKIRATTPSGKF